MLYQAMDNDVPILKEGDDIPWPCPVRMQHGDLHGIAGPDHGRHASRFHAQINPLPGPFPQSQGMNRRRLFM